MHACVIVRTYAMVAALACAFVAPLWTLLAAGGLGTAAVVRRAALDARKGLPTDLAIVHAIHTYAVKVPVAIGSIARSLRLCMEAAR